MYFQKQCTCFTDIHGLFCQQFWLDRWPGEDIACISSVDHWQCCLQSIQCQHTYKTHFTFKLHRVHSQILVLHAGGMPILTFKAAVGCLIFGVIGQIFNNNLSVYCNLGCLKEKIDFCTFPWLYVQALENEDHTSGTFQPIMGHLRELLLAALCYTS